MSHESRPFLDRPLARICALGVVAAVAGALLAMHWDDLFGAGSQQAAAPDNPALAACLDKRRGDIDDMLNSGTITQAQAEQFRERAENFCYAKHGESAGPSGGGLMGR